jgi:hypothetical protein
MSTELDARLKTALDESRLLILGAQVLFGFAFQAVFQELFAEVGTTGRAVHLLALTLMSLSVAFLIAPSLYHQIACRGRTVHSALGVATTFAGASLLPLTLGLGASAFVVFERLAGDKVGIAVGGVLAITACALLYGLGFVFRKERKPPPPETETGLKTKIEQLLTEARVMIPGGQALLGFQFVATLTNSFERLPSEIKLIHLAGLVAVALSVLLLMTPAALHRLAFHGEDDPQFFAIGSRLVVTAAFPLALGISADIAVVAYKIVDSDTAAFAIAGTAFAVFLTAWYVFPALALAYRKPIQRNDPGCSED